MREASEAPLLALDAGSPLLSVAVGCDGEVLAVESAAARRSSTQLLVLVEAALAAAQVAPTALGGIVALAGPGSFTGLRVGLATALGLSQALAIPAAALPTLEVLAAAAGGDDPGRPIVAAVDAIRGEWFVQRFARGESAAPPRRIAAGELPAQAPATLVGFGLRAVVARGPDLAVIEPGPLAPAALRRFAETGSRWDPKALTRPLYLRAPAAVTSARGGSRRP